MSVWLWENEHSMELVLWDGLNTYWTDEMKPSGGYKKMRKGICPITKSRWVYIGEFE